MSGAIEAQREAMALAMAGRAAEAVELLLRWGARSPGDGTLHHNLAVASAMAHDGRAVGVLRAFAEARPGDAQAAFDVANVAHHARQGDAALAAYGRLLERFPGHELGRHHRGMLRLALGRWQGGFADYEARLPFIATGQAPSPRWRGERVGTLLVYSEQGLGDTVLMLRFLAEARRRAGPEGRLVWEAPAELAPLAAMLPEVDQVVVRGNAPPRHDAHVPAMSLPFVLGVKEVSGEACLRADAGLVEAMRRELAGHPRPWVGVAWTGKRGVDGGRHVGGEALVGALRGKGGTLVSAVPGVPVPAGVVDVSPSLVSLHHTAALLAALDEVVTVDNVVANLAGAVGVRGTVLLKWLADWRWGWEGACRWYPSLRLLRQGVSGDWAGVLARLEREG